MTDTVQLPLWLEYPHTSSPMTARGYASSIQDDLRFADIDIDMPTKQGYTVQDIITVIVEAAMQAAKQEAADEIERLRAEPNGVANLQAILADQPYLNSVLTVYQIHTILNNKGGFMPDEAVVWFREMTLRGDWRD